MRANTQWNPGDFETCPATAVQYRLGVSAHIGSAVGSRSIMAGSGGLFLRLYGSAGVLKVPKALKCSGLFCKYLEGSVGFESFKVSGIF